MGKRHGLFHFVLFKVLFLLLVVSIAPAFAQEKSFIHKDLSFTLPEGWVTQEIPANFEKEVIGWLKSEKISGASMLVFSYKGWRQTYTSVRVAGLKTIAASYPKGQEALKKPIKMKTDTGLNAVWEYWRGGVEASGQTVFLESPMGIVETKNCWALFIGFTPTSSGPQLEEDFLKMIKSVK
jgi:hypothetical protein